MKTYNSNMVEIDIKEIIIMLLKKIWIIGAMAVLCAMIAYIYVKISMTPIYESTGSILVLNQKEEAGNSTQLTVSTKLTDDYEKVIMSRNIINQVINNLGLDVTYEELNGSIFTDVESDSRVIKISVQNTSAEIAKKIVDEIQKLSVGYIKDNLEVHAVMVLDDGNIPKTPIGPNVLKYVVVAFAAGLIIAVCGIIVLFVMDDTIRTEKHVEHYLGLTLLGEIRKVEKKTEAYEVLRTNIKAKASNIKSIVVTSTLDKEETENLAYELSVSFAKGNKKVLYVDADLRTVQGTEEIGLVDVLLGEKQIKEVVKDTSNNNLQKITSGKGSEIPSELLDSDTFVTVLNEVKGKYDVIVFNTPALERYIDAAIVAKQCDGVVMAIEYGKTDFQLTQKAIKQLEYVKASVLGCVITKNK